MLEMILTFLVYRYEKMISGKYLGEVVRLALKGLISNGALFGGKSSTKFDTFEAFGTKYLSDIEGGYVSEIGCKFQGQLS